MMRCSPFPQRVRDLSDGGATSARPDACQDIHDWAICAVVAMTTHHEIVKCRTQHLQFRDFAIDAFQVFCAIAFTSELERPLSS